MLKRLQAYKMSAVNLKADWNSFLDMKEMPLDERWAAFVEAPMEWKKTTQDSSIPYKCISSLGIDSPYDDLYMDRRNTRTSVDDVEHFSDSLGEELRGVMITENLIAALKEEIIARRLYAWTWDW